MIRRLLLSLLFLVLLTRWAWITTSTQYGWRFQTDAWRNAFKAMFGVEERDLALQPPEDQARFWLARLQETPQVQSRADLSAGAALMLNAPHPGFLQRHLLSKSDFPGGPSVPLPFAFAVDRSSANQAAEQFHRLCGERCLGLVARAIELEPDNQALWQLRALTLFATLPFRSDIRPRNEQWETILAECATHDPGNALYDYLAAVVYWQGLHTTGGAEDNQNLIDAVQQELARARAYFQAGLKKRGVTVSPELQRYAVAFLDKVAIDVRDQVKAAQAARPSHCLLLVVHEIQKQQLAEIDRYLYAGDTAQAKATLADTLRLAEQLGQESGAAQNRELRLAILETFLPSAMRIEEAVAPGEDAMYAQLRAEVAGLQRALQLQAQQHVPSPWSMALQMVLAMTQFVIFALLAALAVAAAIVVMTWKHRLSTKVAVFLHGLTWVGVTALSFLLLGAFPGRLLPEWLAIWVHRMLLLALFGVMMWAAYKLIRRFSSFSLPLLAMPAAIVTVAVLAGIFASELWGIKLVIPERVPEAIGDTALRPADVANAMNANDHGLGWALYQWHAHSGIACTLLGVLAAVVGWAVIRAVRAAPGRLTTVLHSGKLPLINTIAVEVQRSAYVGLVL